MKLQYKNKKLFSLTIIILLVLLAIPVNAGEIKDVAAMVLSGEIDPVVASKSNEKTVLYEVDTGDTLWSISRNYNTDWELIAAMNDITDTYLVSDQILVVPVVDEEVPDIENYSVCWGDTLLGIADRFRVSIKDVIEFNNIQDPDRLYVGQNIKIPKENSLEVPVFNSVNQLTSRGNIINLSWPILGTITSRFGPRGDGFHHGLDIAAPIGTIIKAARAGEVIFSGWKNNIYGYTVIIKHSSGLRTMYSHNNKNIVTKGQYVRNGEVIAKIGETGNATGPHIHFGVYVNGEAVDPERYLK